MKKACQACGAEYSDHAEYCNVCGGEDLVALIEVGPQPEEPSVREDGQALWIAGVLWLVGLGYLLTVRRPRDAFGLFVGWVLLTTLTFVVGLAVRNMRATLLFSGLSLPFLALYWYLRLLS